MTPEIFLEELTKIFKKHANAENAIAMSKYMKNLFPFYGLKKPVRAEVSKPLIQNAKQSVDEDWIIKTTALLWKQKQREYHYIAIELFRVFKKQITPKSFPHIEKMVLQNSWWDSVDGLTGNIISLLVKKYPELKKEMKRYENEKNMWLRRVAIIHQLPYGKDTDAEFLFKACEQNMKDQEFFIRKAIGWALRQYAKTNSKAVYSFVESNRSALSNLSVREALKHK